ncbi:right-handed parallel beta-helix repeat-containing protein [Ulvibacterium marinum]|uniref:Right-handed parallel beta-helix repeat-containing protein n=1 Tax=Ulvibacterium marinum TaxID=2419782 RepID=A0A3B0CAE1_9FLAO|nr:right-handed parallel beta-helix repeat-containing protein [Ulvibacterium marinum]RKN83445.1 right-handed parallel beta-helix repeat-containing protein [Ulvibacterium marinum]
MKTKKLIQSLILASCICFLGYGKSTIDPVQSYEVYQSNDSIFVRGQIDFKTKYASVSADESLQFALDALKEKGGEVLVHNGRYVLGKQIELYSGIQLRGKGTATVFMLAGSHPTGIAFHAAEKNRVHISDISIVNKRETNNRARIGIDLDHCGDCLVEDVLVVGMKEYGIKLHNDSFLCEIRGARIADSGISGIFVLNIDQGGRGGDFVSNLISNCIIYGGNKGILTDRTMVLNITGCQVYQTKGVAFHISNWSNSVAITGCRTFQISDDAVVVEGSHEINMSGNIFCWHTGNGIVLKNAVWGSITGNNIIDTGSVNVFDETEDKFIKSGDRPFQKPIEDENAYTLYTAIVIKEESKGLVVGNNAIFNWHVLPPMKHGITEDSSCINNVITDNSINFCKDEGVVANGKGSKISNNMVYGDEPYIQPHVKKYQFFDPRVLNSFIEELKEF